MISKKIVAALLTCLCVISTFTLTVFATDSSPDIIDESTSNTIVIDYIYNDDPLDDVNFKLYQIAAGTEIDQYEVLDTYDELAIDLEELYSESYWIELRNELEHFIDYQNLTPDQIFVTDGLGEYKVDDLEAGLYYIEAEPCVEDSVVYFSEPILIAVGYYDDGEEMWLHHFTLQPKIEMMSLDDAKHITVEKIWVDVVSSLLIPESIEVALYRDGEVYDTVVLNEENDWYYVWYDMDPSATWTVCELTELEDYEVSYDRSCCDFQIINTYVGSWEEELPQTGSDANVIPVYAGIGIGLIAFGILIGYNKGKDDEE
ncbi:MAG: Cna B-type domain-containing protein [Eubacteriales bacterium]